jgi:uncharacterized protein YifN (PemK superfamily)
MTTSAQKLDQLILQQQNFQKSLKIMASNMATKKDVTNLKGELIEKISHLPTKEQFYKKMDKWMKATTTHDLEKSAHKRAHERLNDHLAHSHVL